MCVACAHVCYTQQDHLFTKATRNNSPFHARAWVREDMCTSHVCVTHSKIAFSSKQQHTIPPSLILCITHIPLITHTVHHSYSTHHSYCAYTQAGMQNTTATLHAQVHTHAHRLFLAHTHTHIHIHIQYNIHKTDFITSSTSSFLRSYFKGPPPCKAAFRFTQHVLL